MSGVGFIGLGQIGAPMAERLTGWPGGLFVCDTDPAATARLVGAGAVECASPREVAEQCDVVSVMVRDDEQVRAVVDGPNGVLAGAHPGASVLVHSTISPQTAVDLGRRAQTSGVHLLDAPVSGGAGGARDGRLAIMVGGSEEGFGAGRPVLERLGDLVVHLGPTGAGTRAKLARNLLHFVAFAAVAEASRLAEAAHVDLIALGRIVRHTDAITGGPGAIMFRAATSVVSSGDPLYPILDGVRRLGEKDLALAIQLADDLGVDTPLARLAVQRLGAGLGIVGPCADTDAEAVAPDTEAEESRR